MSWSGPVAGATPYQPPPYANSQAGYGQQQPPFQYGQQQSTYNQYQAGPTYPQNGGPPRPSDNRPPKKKGNPIITRYPPPPGYRGPAQPQGPYATNQYPNQYQPPQQPFPQGPNASPTYPSQGYSAPNQGQGYSPRGYGPPHQSPYQQPGYQQGPNYQWPQQNYSPNQGYPQGPNYAAGQSFTSQNTHPSYSSQASPVNPTQPPQPPSGQGHNWQQPNSQASFSSSGQHSTGGPDSGATPTSNHPSASQTTSSGPQPGKTADETIPGEKPQLFLAWDDWDFDFDGAIWPKSNEPVDPNLSLGVIIWRPAKQMTRALPSTFDEAEDQALQPPPEKLGNGESVSIYFTAENSHEAFLDVRQTDEWERIQHDPAFVVFTDDSISHSLVPLEECIAQRERPDLPLVEIETKRNEDEEMHDSTWNVMDNLEQALSGHDDKVKATRPQLTLSRRQTQEDILAQLGVTGSPKPPSDEPISMPGSSVDEKPVSLPPKPPALPLSSIPPRPEQLPQRSHSYGGQRTTSYAAPPPRPYGSMSSSTVPRSSSPKNSQMQPNTQTLETIRGSPARSESSNHALMGGDAEAEQSTSSADKTTTTIPQLHRSDSSSARKRSYGDTDQDDEKLRQHDDHARRKRRSQVAAAYGRR